MTETPNTVHGRLLEAVHISGYSFERACSELEWLLGEDRWKRCGYDDIAEFQATIDWSEFRMAVEKRKNIAKQLAAIGASQRATAKMLGVSAATVNSDLQGVQNRIDDTKKPAEMLVDSEPSVQNQTPEWFQDGVDPAKLSKTQAARNKRADEQANRDEGLSAKELVWPEGKYGVLYADPPWRYEHPPIGASNRSIENHYPTMTLDEICALPVQDIAAENAVLFLWATAPKLAECIQVIEVWGFTYRTCMVWVKDKIGMGYHARNKHEILLISKRGQLAPPDPPNRPDSVLEAARTKHSAKPEEYYGLIESMYPTHPRIELFARKEREGWEVWGNQANA